jgi:hypothetical protein
MRIVPGASHNESFYLYLTRPPESEQNPSSIIAAAPIKIERINFPLDLS